MNSCLLLSALATSAQPLPSPNGQLGILLIKRLFLLDSAGKKWDSIIKTFRIDAKSKLLIFLKERLSPLGLFSATTAIAMYD